ncbi:MAG: PIN domain-containing protein [Methylococcaceae bacterium]|nr:PIN domain-containing protein [Methylococcaceae bacterium]
MRVLIDTSIWIDYFKSGNNSNELDGLLDDNLVVINNIILAELVPFLVVKKQFKIIDLLNNIKLLPLQTDWPEIIRWQTLCLSTGNNGIGIPDLNDCPKFLAT